MYILLPDVNQNVELDKPMVRFTFHELPSYLYQQTSSYIVDLLSWIFSMHLLYFEMSSQANLELYAYQG